VGRPLIHRLQKLVCRIRGHKLQVISEDVLWECQRCRDTLLSESFLKSRFKVDTMPPWKRGQPSSPVNGAKKPDNGSKS
jgi:hypothetical protein